MKNKFGIILALVAALSLALVGCGSNGDQQASSDGEGAQYVFKLGHSQPPEHHFNLGMEKFAELVDQKTDGKVKVEVFPSGQLGGTRDRTEGVKMGTADMEFVGSPDLAKWVPQFSLFDLPFMIDDYDQADKLMDGAIGEKLAKAAKDKGFILLGMGENGFRNVFTKNKPINSVEDLKGLKVRVYPNQVYVETFKELGALPATTDWGELFTALSQGTVDGAEAAEAHFMTNKFYEAGQKYFTKTRHMYIPAVLIMNKDKFESLPKDLQTAVKEAAQEAVKYQRKISRDQAEKFLKEMGEKGVKVNELQDKTPFIEATKGVYDKFVPTIGEDLVNEAREELNK